jgi:Transposase
MFIKGVTKESPTGRKVYFRLCESYRDHTGKPRQRMILGLGELPELPRWEDKKTLAGLLNSMVLEQTYPLCEHPTLLAKAVEIYHTLESQGKIQQIVQTESALAKAVRMEEERRKRECVSMELSSLKNLRSRRVGAEHVCLSALRKLRLDSFLLSHHWSREQVDTALMQIAARAIYPYSELKTVSYLQENSALCELLNISPETITKDVLYQSARRLYDFHRELETWLHNRVRTLFHMEDKILLFDLSNTYFEGKMDCSALCKFGRSKEKRSDCKLVVFAAVVNTDGMLVRTEIFEGNTADSTTMQHILSTLDTPEGQGKKKIVVMDAGISVKENLDWLKAHGYQYITVMRSSNQPYISLEEGVKTVTDNKKQVIRLEKVRVEGWDDTVLLVDSQAKSLKEKSMSDKFHSLFGEGLKAV